MDKDFPPYKILYADPPWDNLRVDGHTAVDDPAQSRHPDESLWRRVSPGEITAEDGVLFMWARFPLFTQALSLGLQWGFQYKTVAFVWVKRNQTGHFINGTGYYTRSNAEPVLLFTKGEPLMPSGKEVGQIVMTVSPREGGKPLEVRERIDRLFGEEPKAELLSGERLPKEASHTRRRWDRYGMTTDFSILVGRLTDQVP
ncbi:MAG: MT-A70 family methyltransferase [Puia sp.]|nr:MT-A70 family methyltransferase [Puia sp.]